MEIQVRQILTGRALRRQILERYGSRAALEALVKRARNPDASEALITLRLLAQDPKRLDTVWTLQEEGELDAHEVSLLTPQRIRLFEQLRVVVPAMNVSGLARHLGRDKKNVSEDVSVLARLGLVWVERRGRQAVVRPIPGEIHIVLAAEDQQPARRGHTESNGPLASTVARAGRHGRPAKSSTKAAAVSQSRRAPKQLPGRKLRRKPSQRFGLLAGKAINSQKVKDQLRRERNA